MEQDLIARASTRIEARPDTVWKALVDPAAIKEYWFGAEVASDWKEGSPITWKGEWKGKPYEDKGEVLAAARGRRLQYSHFSPMSGKPDRPENYHTVTIDLLDEGGDTCVSLSQDNNADENAMQHSRKTWEAMLSGLKEYVEKH